MLIVIGSLAGGHGLWHPLESAVVGTPLLVVTAPSILHIRHRSSLSLPLFLCLLFLSLSLFPKLRRSRVQPCFLLQTVSPSNVGNLGNLDKAKSKSKRQESCAGKPTSWHHVGGGTHTTGLAVAPPSHRSMKSLNLDEGWISEIYGHVDAVLPWQFRTQVHLLLALFIGQRLSVNFYVSIRANFLTTLRSHLNVICCWLYL